MVKKKVRKAPSQLESELEKMFYNYWLSIHSSRPVLQYRFHPYRQFRFDFCWPSKKVAVEVQGIGPGHCSLKGMTGDYDKHLEALLLNWKIVYLTKTHLSERNISKVCDKIAKLLGIEEYSHPSTIPYIPRRKR